MFPSYPTPNPEEKSRWGDQLREGISGISNPPSDQLRERPTSRETTVLTFQVENSLEQTLYVYQDQCSQPPPLKLRIQFSFPPRKSLRFQNPNHTGRRPADFHGGGRSFTINIFKTHLRC